MNHHYEYRECLRCEFIEDCPHPTVSQEGKPIPPTVCSRPDKIKLTKRTQEQKQ